MVNYKFLLTSIVFLIVFSFNVSAFAVTSYYWEEHPLTLEPGQTKDVQAFGLQNLVDGKDLTAIATLGSGKGIAQIIDSSNIYFVPFGRKDVYVNLRITIPENTPIGKEYDVGVSFSITPNNEGKTVQLVSGIDSSIKVRVGKEEEKLAKVVEKVGKRRVNVTNNLLLGLITLLIVVVAIYYFGFIRGKNLKVKKKR